MPNWCENKLIVRGSFADVQGFVNKYIFKNDSNEDTFSFNKVIPMPESLNIECSSSQGAAIAYYLSESNPENVNSKHPVLSEQEFNDKFNIVRTYHASAIELYDNLPPYFSTQSAEKNDEAYVLGKAVIDNYINYGCSDWYDWCNKNWGTKWDACECSISELTRYSEDFADLIVYFDTAWAPPAPVIRKLIDDNPSLHIRCSFYEGGMEIAGYIDSKDGEYYPDDIREFTIEEGFMDEEAWSEMEEDEDEDEDNEEESSSEPLPPVSPDIADQVDVTIVSDID